MLRGGAGYSGRLSLGGILVGALYGAMAVAFGQVVSGSTLSIVLTILAGAALGAWAGRWPGLAVGAILATMLTAFGALISGSAVGVWCSVGAVAALGGWLGRPPAVHVVDEPFPVSELPYWVRTKQESVTCP
jgi:hypothetical protein